MKNHSFAVKSIFLLFLLLYRTSNALLCPSYLSGMTTNVPNELNEEANRVINSVLRQIPEIQGALQITNVNLISNSEPLPIEPRDLSQRIEPVDLLRSDGITSDIRYVLVLSFSVRFSPSLVYPGYIFIYNSIKDNQYYIFGGSQQLLPNHNSSITLVRM